MKTKAKTKAILFLILAASLAMQLFWASQKQGYHVDEMYMYGTANSEYLPFMHLGYQEYSVKDWMRDYGAGDNIAQLFRNLAKDFRILKENSWDIKGSVIYSDYLRAQACSNDMYSTGWMTGQDYTYYLSPAPENRFNFISVLYNFRGDNHPPLYALLLHFVCSFFPGVFSKWTGLLLNALIVSLCICLLYRMVKDYLGGERPALMTAAAYGLSTAAAVTSTYIRMYSLLTLMVVGMAYVHLRLHAKDWQWKKSDRRILVFFTLCGYLSQYYFVIYAAGIAMAAVILQIKQKKYKSLLRYLLTMGISGIVGILLWPFSLKAVFSGSRGQESISGFFSLSGLASRFEIMLDVLSRSTLGCNAIIFLALMLLLAVGFLFACRPKKDAAGGKALEKALLLVLPFLLYFIAVTKMIPYLVDRYIMCILPWPFVLLICGAAPVLRSLPLKDKAFRITAALLFLLLLVCSDSFLHGNGYTYRGGQECFAVEEGTDCVYIEPSNWWNVSAEDTLILSRCRNVAVTREDTLPELLGTYEAESGSRLLLVLREGVDTEACLSLVTESLAMDTQKTILTAESREDLTDRTIVYFSVR